jgi:hypothetical protein
LTLKRLQIFMHCFNMPEKTVLSSKWYSAQVAFKRFVIFISVLMCFSRSLFNPNLDGHI